MAAPTSPHDEGSTVITFDVVKESYGWAVRRDRQMMTPMWCRALAVAEAERMAAALRRHGAQAKVRICETENPQGSSSAT
jgi:hypothetical protein